MRSIAALLPALLLLLAPPAETGGVESATGKAHEHVRKACELVWSAAPAHEIDRCTERAMAALGEHDQLRDSELKRLILDSDQELETCRAEREELKEELRAQETSAAKRNPRFPGRP